MISFAKSKYKNLSISPRKVRLVADLIRGMDVQKAIDMLSFVPKRSSPFMKKLILSAVNNYHQKYQDTLSAQLYIKEVRVDGGRVLKRIQPASQGRALPIRKRSSHVEIVVMERPENSKKDK